MGCTKYTDEQVYWIKKGRSTITKRRVSPTEDNVTFTFTFTENNKYIHELEDWQPRDFQNKLYGLTSSVPHENSARISWRQVEHKFEVLAYYYVDGDWGYHPIYEALVGEQLYFNIDIRNNEYRFSCNDSIYVVENTPSFAAFRMFPYFGWDRGNIRCPHDMYFIIREI